MEIAVPDELYNRLVEFKQVVEAVIDEEMGFDDFAALTLSQGIKSMLNDLLGNLDQTTLLVSFQQLGEQYSMQVYKYITEVMNAGGTIQERERMRRQLGFRPSGTTDSEAS